MRKEKDRFNPREWDEIYFAFIESRVGVFSRGAHEGFYNLVPDKDASILDVGCGTGRDLIEWSSQGFSRLYGVEPDPELTGQIPKGLHVATAPAQKLPFETGMFDVVFVYGVLRHMPYGA